MGLTAKEKSLLERLQAKAEEPEAPAVSKATTVIVDLKDAASVAMAKAMGFLPGDEVEEEESEGEEEKPDEKPARQGYFRD